MHSVAFFVSPHGFGHAARASAVMLELVQQAPEVRLEIFTRVPEWFFADTLRVPFGYHDLLTDIGMAQRTPLAEDLEETQRRLETFLPFSDDLLAEWAGGLHELGCRLVVCDISPLGIAIGRRAGLPVVLLENFTWDWIYTGYLRQAGEAGAERLDGLATAIRCLGETFAMATAHIQTQPVCWPRPAMPLRERSPLIWRTFSGGTLQAGAGG